MSDTRIHTNNRSFHRRCDVLIHKLKRGEREKENKGGEYVKTEEEEEKKNSLAPPQALDPRRL